VSVNLTLVFEVVAFFAFIYLFKRWFWAPILGAMEDREQRIADGLAAAERGQQQLLEVREQAEQILDEARRQASEILAQANKRHTEMLEQARAEARAEGQRIVNAARSEIEQEVVRARESLRAELGNLIMEGTERVLRREVDSKAHNDLVEELVAQI